MRWKARQQSASSNRGQSMQAGKVGKTLGARAAKAQSILCAEWGCETDWFICYTSEKWPTCPHCHADYKEFAKKIITLKKRDILPLKTPAKIPWLDNLNWASLTCLCNNRALCNMYCLSKAGITRLKKVKC